MKSYRLFQVNESGEQIDFVNREFKSREEAQAYMNANCEGDGWVINECSFIVTGGFTARIW